MKKLLALTLALLMVLSLAACGSSVDPTAQLNEIQAALDKIDSALDGLAAAAPAAPAEEGDAEEPAEEAPAAPVIDFEPATVRVAYMPNLGSAGSLFVGIDQGFFEEVGLNVEVYEFQGGPAEIAAMASGDIDISQIGHGAHALCIEGEAVIFAMDHTTSLSDVVVGNRSHGIETAADLAGKTVAVSSGTSSEIILQQALAAAGLTMDDIEVVEMTVDTMTTAMIAGQLDACAAWSPNTIVLQDQLGDDYVNLGGNADFLDSAIFPSSYITTQAYADEHHDILVRFAMALNKAHDYRLANQEDMAKSLAKHIDSDEETQIRALGEADWETITKVCGDMDAIKTVYETQQGIFLNNGRITEPVDVDNYVLFDVMQEAYDAYEAAK